MISWTAEQILAMSPDSAAAAAGSKLASRDKWASLGCSERAAWGECQGSGTKPYQVQIDLSEPAFKCTCPSRKFPCKHGLGLFLLLAENAVRADAEPDWVTEWLTKRAVTSKARESKAAERDPEAEAKAAAGQEKRAAQREGRVAAGMEEVDLWLTDLIRSGLAAAQSYPGAFWEGMAARMVDAQAPGVARRIRELAVMPATGTGWADRMVEAIGRLRLLIEAYRNIGSQPEEMQATIRAHVGWTVKQEELTKEEGIRAEWLVVGRRVTLEDKLLVQRTWLLGRPGSALLLHFAMRGQAFEISFMPGGCLDAELVYFPGSLRRRAVVKSLLGEAPTLKAVPCHGDIGSYFDSFAAALASDPWVETHLASLTRVTPVKLNDRWLVCDQAGSSLPIHPSFQKGWQLLSLSGGSPVTLFGEWDGHALYPLCVLADRRFVDLSPVRGA